jgi:hypothetical protein
MEQLWNNQESVSALVDDLKDQTEYHLLFVSEAKAVSTYAPENIKSLLAEAIEHSPSVPSTLQINAARSRVSEDPYNISLIKDLISLEKGAGNKMMVAYLEGRKNFVSQIGVVKR